MPLYPGPALPATRGSGQKNDQSGRLGLAGGLVPQMLSFAMAGWKPPSGLMKYPIRFSKGFGSFRELVYQLIDNLGIGTGLPVGRARIKIEFYPDERLWEIGDIVGVLKAWEAA
jgi:hypothetical protein